MKKSESEGKQGFDVERITKSMARTTEDLELAGEASRELTERLRKLSPDETRRQLRRLERRLRKQR